GVVPGAAAAEDVPGAALLLGAEAVRVLTVAVGRDVVVGVAVQDRIVRSRRANRHVLAPVGRDRDACVAAGVDGGVLDRVAAALCRCRAGAARSRGRSTAATAATAATGAARARRASGPASAGRRAGRSRRASGAGRAAAAGRACRPGGATRARAAGRAAAAGR